LKFKPIRNRGIVCRRKTMLLDARRYCPQFDDITILSTLRQRGRTWLVCRPFWCDRARDKHTIERMPAGHIRNIVLYASNRATDLTGGAPALTAALAYGRFSGFRFVVEHAKKHDGVRVPTRRKARRVNGWRKRIRAIGKAEKTIARRREVQYQ
jgi:hypothetical protein